MSRALVLRHHLEDDAGLIGTALSSLGYSLRTVLVNETHRAPELDAEDIVIILGSTSSVYDESVQAAWLNHEVDLVRIADQQAIPVLGICFGAQVLCHAFGGRVELAPESEIGWTEIEVRSGIDLESGPWFEYHADRCVLPTDATVWASSSRAVQAFTIGKHLGVQFHPEIDDEQLARWFASPSDVPRAHDDREEELLEETRRQTPSATIRAAHLVDLFLAHCRQ